MNDPWWTNSYEVAALCEWLVDEHGYDLKEVLSVVREPSKWDNEYRSMQVLLSQSSIEACCPDCGYRISIEPNSRMRACTLTDDGKAELFQCCPDCAEYLIVETTEPPAA